MSTRRASPFEDTIHAERNRERLSISGKRPLSDLLRELRQEGMIVPSRMVYHPDVITQESAALNPDVICTDGRS